MTMRDYKMVCPSYSMLVNGKPCEACSQGRYYNCYLKKCTKNSSIKSLVNTVEMYLHHKILRIYNNIDVFVSPSRFLKKKVEEMGLRGEIVHLANFVELNSYEPQYSASEDSIAYVGRLSVEKGVSTLIEAVKTLTVKLKIIGDGPLLPVLKRKIDAENITNVEFLGFCTSDVLKDEVSKSLFTVLPSECYENNPRSIIESFSLGKPAIGAKIGGIPELVRDNETGFTFTAGDSSDLREKIELLLSKRDLIQKMGKSARKFVETELNAERHYAQLMKIYEMAVNKNALRARH